MGWLVGVGVGFSFRVWGVLCCVVFIWVVCFGGLGVADGGACDRDGGCGCLLVCFWVVGGHEVGGACLLVGGGGGMVVLGYLSVVGAFGLWVVVCFFGGWCVGVGCFLLFCFCGLVLWWWGTLIGLIVLVGSGRCVWCLCLGVGVLSERGRVGLLGRGASYFLWWLFFLLFNKSIEC